MSRAFSISEIGLADRRRGFDIPEMLDEIKIRQAKVPFEPFIIRLNNGRNLLVAGRETVRVRPQHNVLLFSNDELDAAEDFDASMIVSLEKAPARSRKRLIVSVASTKAPRKSSRR